MTGNLLSMYKQGESTTKAGRCKTKLCVLGPEELWPWPCRRVIVRQRTGDNAEVIGGRVMRNPAHLCWRTHKCHPMGLELTEGAV